MVTGRIESLFRDRKNDAQGALLSYISAGFPDLAVTEQLIRRCDALGATVIELGIPYSDSIADGPVIQASFHKALEAGFRLKDAFALLERVRPDVSCGLVAMVSFSVVHRTGVDAFMARAAEAGFDGVILPDLPAEEAGSVCQIVKRRNLAHIGLVAPTTSPDRRKAIVESSSGFVYQIARAGLTGEGSNLDPRLPQEVEELRRISGLPVCVGFGVSTAGHVRQVCSFADGAIVGSAIVRRIAEADDAGLSLETLTERVSTFIAQLMEGTRALA